MIFAMDVTVNMILVQSFFGTLKKEELYRIRYRSERQMKECIESYIKFYNEERLHERLNYKTPDQIEAEYHSNFNGNQL
jgi:transposase InsO family protein